MTFEQVRRVALAIAGVEEGTSYGTPAFKLRGKLILRLREEGDAVVILAALEEREAMMAEDPETYYLTDHYLKYPYVLARLSRLTPEALRDLLGRACRLAAAGRRGGRR